MPSTYTNSLDLQKPGKGELSGVWDIVVNRNFDKIDAVKGGITSINLTSNKTIQTAQNEVSEFETAILQLSGNLSTIGANRTVTLPDGKSGKWIVDLSGVTFGTRNVVFKTASQSGGVTVVSATEDAIQIFSNGSSVKRVGEKVVPWIIGEIKPYIPPTGTVVSANLPSGWHVANGNNGTINLTNKFLYGTNNHANYLSETKTGGATSDTVSLGTFTYSGDTGSTILNTNQIPAHRHLTVGAAAGVGSNPTNLSASTPISPSTTNHNTGNNDYILNASTGDAIIGRSSSVGGNQGHTHTISISKSLGSIVVDTVPPYYRVVWIQYTAT